MHGMQQQSERGLPLGLRATAGGARGRGVRPTLPGGARRLRYRGQENKAHEMKARVRPSGIATTRAMPAPPSGRATRSAAAGPIAATSRTPGAARRPCPSPSLSKR